MSGKSASNHLLVGTSFAALTNNGYNLSSAPLTKSLYAFLVFFGYLVLEYIGLFDLAKEPTAPLGALLTASPDPPTVPAIEVISFI